MMIEKISSDIKQVNRTKDEKPQKVPVSRGVYILCHFVFFVLGLCHTLPMTFFTAANNFWLYKFRNTSNEFDPAANRTILQTNFASSTMVANAVPSLMFGLFNVAFANRFKILGRIFTSLTIEVVIFILLVASVRVDTDTYQVPFFVLILGAYATFCAANTVLIVASMNLFGRFPQGFMKTCLAGQGSAGIISGVLNILSIYIFSDDILDSTLLYFLAGMSTVSLTLFCTFILSRTRLFIYYLKSVPENTEKKLPSRRDLMSVAQKIRFYLLLMAVHVSAFIMTHTPVTALVVSEQDSTISSWAKNYFSPVMTFLLSDISLLTGRLLAYIPYRLGDTTLAIFTVVRTVILVPMIWLCNAQKTGRRLPVLFPHDYQYGIILGTFMITTGYLMNITPLGIVERLEKEESDMGLTLYALAINVYQTISSLIGLVIVNIL